MKLSESILKFSLFVNFAKFVLSEIYAAECGSQFILATNSNIIFSIVRPMKDVSGTFDDIRSVIR